MKTICLVLLFLSNHLIGAALLGLLGLDNNVTSCATPPACKADSCYRNIDGSCNNLNRPTMGMTGMPYGRMCDDNYSDGQYAMPKAKSGNPLPNAREISWQLSPEIAGDNNKCTAIIVLFGQLIAHDNSFTSGVTQLDETLISCCDKDKNILTKLLANPRCAPIFIPDNDPVYVADGTSCLHLARTLTTADKKCYSQYKSPTPISDVTAWIDGSPTYGSLPESNKDIREFKGGLLKAVIRNGRTWPPQQPDAEGSCSGQNPTEPCYLAGDFRITQSPQLAIVQIILFLEHNRICKEMVKMNPDWSDEKLFQECRRIVIATIQNIVYGQYLSALIGLETCKTKRLIYEEVGYVDDYNVDGDGAILLEYATAADRSFHSLASGVIKMYNEDRQSNQSLLFDDYYFKPGFIENGFNFHDMSVGLVTQPCRIADQYFDDAFNQNLFRIFTPHGSDLRTLDIQRGRDHGLCTYVKLRKACDLFVPKCFDDLKHCGISKENIAKLKKLYECVDDLEPTVMIPLERPAVDAQIGPTGVCVIVKQYLKTRTSDRFFFQNGQPHVSFTPEQLKSIRTGTSMSGLFCNNIPQIESIQPNAFLLISKDNPLKPCAEIPRLDLGLWKGSKCC